MENFEDIKNSIKDLQKQISDALLKSSGETSTVQELMKYGVIVLSLVLAVVQFWPSDNPITGAQIVGVCAALAVAFLTFVSLQFERDHHAEMGAAIQSNQKAQELFPLNDLLKDFEGQLDRADDLLVGMRAVFEIIEQASLKVPPQDELVHSVLRCSESAIKIAAKLGAVPTSHWTITVYKVDVVDGEEMLRMVASHRAVPVVPGAARKWRKGEGVAGSAWASGREIIIPNVNSPSLGGAFDPHDGRGRKHDQGFYVSFAACPILVGKPQAKGEDPSRRVWGVVVATSDRLAHFETSGAAARNVVPIRMLASAVGAGLGLEVARKSPESPTTDEPQAADSDIAPTTS